MIWSRYNEFIQGSDKVNVLFNCRTRKWITFVPELYRLLQDNANNLSKIESRYPSLYKVLIDNKFIVPDLETEISECLAEIDSKLNSSKLLKLTVNPTLDCNLRCWYCYEQHLHGSCMTLKIMESFYRYIDTCLSNGKYEKLQLAFFGGEPLMKFDKVVNPMLIQVKKICNQYNVDFAVSFTTNGVLLTHRVRTAIKSITQNVAVQIPFDGDSEFHNNVKRFPNGMGSYQIVKNHAREAVIDGFRVTIRCNATKSNIHSFQNVINDFEDLLSQPNLRFSFHKVWQEADDDEFKSEITALKSAISHQQFTSNIHSYFGDSVNPCYGDYADNYVFNYNGDIFKCTARDFNTKNRIGHLNDNGEIAFNNSALIRTKKSLTAECPTCRRLPFCPICSQTRAESSDGKCPAHITPEEITLNIHQFYLDLSRT